MAHAQAHVRAQVNSLVNIYIKSSKEWQEGIAKNITFIVTKDCQLACKYCYLVGKNAKERMPWEVAKQAIDYILDHESEFKEESVVWDFIGKHIPLPLLPYLSHREASSLFLEKEIK